MKILFREHKKMFFVNEEKGIVVCKIEGSFDNKPEHFEYARSLTDHIWKCMSFVGKAKLNDGDEWDETLGRRIAEDRAIKKMQQEKVRLYGLLMNDLLIETDLVGREIETISRKIDNTNAHIDRLITENDIKNGKK